MRELVAPEARLELLAEGFGFTEGPVWHESGRLFFTDVARDTIWTWSEDGGAQPWLTPTHYANGMTRDPEGGLLVCEQTTSVLSRYDEHRVRSVIASHYQGKELNSPNDVVCRSDGIVYFTDPPAGREGPHGPTRPGTAQLPFHGVFLLRPGSIEPELLLDDMVVPNGLCFSPDESVLYVNDTLRMQIVACDVAADGSVLNRRVYFQQPGEPPDPHALGAELKATGTIGRGLPDGMRCDAFGNVYCGGPGGVWVTDPAGTQLGVLEVPRFVGNLAWGGEDWCSLFLCASGSLYRLRLGVPGAPPAFPR
jgi:gluconolactonase